MVGLIPILIVIAFLLVYLFKRGAWPGALMALFVYASLHSIYALFIAANSGDGAEEMIKIHQAHSVLIQIIGSAFIGFCGLVMMININKNDIKKHYGVLFLILVVAALFLISMIPGLVGINDYHEKKQVVKGVLSSVMMWGMVIIIALSLGSNKVNIAAYKNDIIIFVGALLAIMPVLGLYEIGIGVVWARTGDAERASAALFNPNVLGVWCALLGLLVSMFFNLGWLSKRNVFLFMALLVISLILSGSRSGLILSVANLLVVSCMLLINRATKNILILDKLWPLMMFLSSFLVAAFFIELLRLAEIDDANIYFANLQRFISFPSEMLNIVLHQIGGYVALCKTSTTFVNLATLESVNGRLEVGVFSDNLYLAIYALGGYVSLFLWLMLCGTMLWMAVKKHMANPCVYSIYALAATMACIALGMFLRSAQLFPLWIFMSIVLGLSMRWWLFVQTEAG